MSTKIIPKKSTVSGKIPSGSDLEAGEVAINLTDAIFYAKHTDGSIVNLSGAPELHNHSIAQVSGLQTALNSKANLNSPALTGTPTAPTAAAGDNTSKIATTAYVQSEIAELGSGSLSSVSGVSPISVDATDANNPIISVTNATTTSDGAMSSSDKAKLNGIQAGAQVNSVTSVNSKTGAVTLSTTDVNEGTNLYHTTARARSAISVSGDLSYSNGVISFNETYSNAAQIKTAYESNTNTNAFTDALQSKLNGIQAGAQVNVGTNLGSSGTGASRTITSSTGSNTTITYSASDVGAAPASHNHTLANITDSGNLAAINTNSSTSNYLRGDGTWATPPNTNTTYSAGTGITLSGTTFSLTNESYTLAEKNKLSGIESGATADQTASEILTALKTVDGSGSGLDADMVDGKHVGSSVGDLMLVGESGFGATAAPAITDFNSITKNSIHRFELNPLNGPGESYGTVLTMVRDSTRRTQIASNLSGKIWFRSESSTGWGDWAEFYHTRNFNPATKVDKSKALIGGTSDDGVNSLQASGGTRTDTLAAGGVQDAQESIDTAGNVQVRGEGQVKMGQFAIQYNANTKSLDFNFTGS